jgi:type I restriction enzyme S subunit
MNYPRYPEYKPSGVEWLGEVPAHWDVLRLRFAIKTNPTKSEITGLEPAAPVSFVPMEAVGAYGGLNLEAEKSIDDIGTGYTYFRDGDVVVAKITPCFENGKGALAAGLKNGIAFGTTEQHVLRPSESMDEHFLFYLTISQPFREVGASEMYGAGGQKRVSDEFIRDLRPAIPPLDEQRAIAAFLDRETARIDALITKKLRLIELLAEKRTALISQAVTKGLSPDAPMKDSGVEWLGEIPAHWDVARVKFVAKLESGHTPSKQVPEYWENCDIPWVSLNDSKQLAVCDYISETKYQISRLGLENSSARVLPPGAVVFTRDATIGLAAITTKEMAVSQHLIAWIPSYQIRAEYLLRVFSVMKAHLDSYTFGATIKTIGMPDVKKLVTTLPPLDEQKAIEEFVKTNMSQLDRLASSVESAIARLQEYRNAVIAAAVTGKIDVRGLNEEREVA